MTIDDRLRVVLRPLRTVPGWATVELDRAERELAAALGSISTSAVTAPDDVLLGARCRSLRQGDGAEIVFLEPATEGPLAAALARHGEGWLVTFLVVDTAAIDRARATGYALSPEAAGPLGVERRVEGGPRSGPFTMLVVAG